MHYQTRCLIQTAVERPRDWLTVNDFGSCRFPALEYLTLRSAAISTPSGNYSSSLPYFAPLPIALSRSSSPHSVHLAIHLRFHIIPIFERGESDSDIKWPDVTFLDELLVFRRPIELHISCFSSMTSVGHLFRQSSDIQRLLEDGKISLIEDYIPPCIS